MTINELVQNAYENAKEKGFYDNWNNQNIGCLLMQIVSELSEAMEAHRQGKYMSFVSLPPNFTLPKMDEIKDTFEVEIADAFIRLASLCGYLNIDIEKFINAKMEYNKLREPLHGKKY